MKVTSEIQVELVQHVGGDQQIAAAARVSVTGVLDLKQDECGGLINYLMKNRHGTPFEHGSMTFFVRAPIFVWREWHRHRVGFSYNEESGRYKQLEAEFWIPRRERKMVPTPEHKSARPSFQRIESDNSYIVITNMLESSYASSYLRYEQLLELGVAKEVARACLPVATYSSCWVTCNPRSLMAFLSLRTSDSGRSRPQAEIEEAAHKCEAIFAKLWPLTYAAFVSNGRVGP